jgi:uncharacterized protein YeaO (DUF488 family)
MFSGTNIRPGAASAERRQWYLDTAESMWNEYKKHYRDSEKFKKLEAVDKLKHFAEKDREFMQLFPYAMSKMVLDGLFDMAPFTRFVDKMLKSPPSSIDDWCEADAKYIKNVIMVMEKRAGKRVNMERLNQIKREEEDALKKQRTKEDKQTKELEKKFKEDDKRYATELRQETARKLNDLSNEDKMQYIQLIMKLKQEKATREREKKEAAEMRKQGAQPVNIPTMSEEKASEILSHSENLEVPTIEIQEDSETGEIGEI